MKTMMRVTGWTLRASALICMVWIVTQVVSGKIDTLPMLLSSVLWHAGFALSGVALVGAAASTTHPAEETVSPVA